MRRPDPAYLLGLGGLVLWVFRRPLFEGMVLYKRDIHLVWQAQVETFVRAIAGGSWPVWDPSLGAGQPLLADPSAQVAYPFTWLNLVLRPWTYYTLFAASHVLFGGVGLYLLGRRWTMSRGAAFVAAGLFLLSGPFLSMIDLWHHLASAAWIPWVLLAADAAFEKPGTRSALLWGAALAGQILGGSADMSAMTGLAVGGLVLARYVRWRDPLCLENGSLALTCFAALGLAVGLSAVVWLPALDVASRSVRWELPAAIRTYWSLHPASALGTLLPVPWQALPLKPSLSTALFEGREPFLASLYLGAPTLSLVGAGLALSSAAKKRFVAGVGAAALLVALGRNAPIYGLLTALLPPLQVLRYPVKAMAFVALCWALLAGFGFDAWRTPAPADRRRFIAAALGPAGALALAAMAVAFLARSGEALWGPLLLAEGSTPGPETLSRIAWRLSVTAALATGSALLALSRRPGPRASRSAGSVALLALLDLGALHRNIAPVAPRTLYAHRPEVLGSLAGSDRPRVYVYDYSQASPRYGKRDALRGLARVPEGWDLEAGSALALQVSLAPTTAGRWGVDTGFDVDYRGLYSRNLAEISRLIRYLEGTPRHLRLLQIGGITHVVALHREGLEDLLPVAVVPGFYEAPIRVFRVPDALPRTYVVGGVSVASGREALDLLLDPAFDPRRAVLLSEGANRPAPEAAPGTSRILERRADRVRIEADLLEEAYVVLLDGYDPGWRVQVDGQESRLLSANLVFRAVRVPAGRHQIELVYRPRAVTLGLTVSTLAAAAALAVALRVFGPTRAPWRWHRAARL